MAQLVPIYSTDLDPMPEFESHGETARFDDTIIMEDGWPNMTIDFDVQAEMDELSERVLKGDLSALLAYYKPIEDNPKTITVSRPSSDPSDDRIIAVIRSESGAYLGSILGDANGMGTLVFTPPES